jgi:hypothetical protein
LSMGRPAAIISNTIRSSFGIKGLVGAVYTTRSSPVHVDGSALRGVSAELVISYR